MKNYKKKILSLGLIGILVLSFGTWDKAEAADPSIYIYPAQGNKGVGEVFDINIRVSPDGQKACVVEGKLILNKLSCQKVTMGSGISVQDSPSCDDLGFLIGIQGCTTNNKTLFTVRVKTKSAGVATANFTGVDIIGEGVSISSDSIGCDYTVSSVCDCGTWSLWRDSLCGGGNCYPGQRLQSRTRSCTPSGCDTEIEYRCKEDAGCFVTETPATEGDDIVPPVISLLGSSTINVNVGDLYTDPGATASDNIDGDITKDITVVNPVDTSETGNYIITYNVSDSAGNQAEEVTRTVIVKPLPTEPPLSVGERKTMPKGFLANLRIILDEISQSAFYGALLTLCGLGLVVIGSREWKRFWDRKKK